MIVGILYTIIGTTASALLAEFAGGTLHGEGVTPSCQFYAAGDDALFLGPASSFDYDDWLEGDSSIITIGDTYDDVIAEMTVLNPLVAEMIP